ncbi:hypothetical protein VR7_gp135 [Escherichia phage vB_EcoM_VR7]|uniref:Uncharacterized protein VR7ORF135c n=2 Tax=Gaprivervirus TaxID=1913654 RepID=E5FIX8_9CAUD|nr:restriction endonuclease [Escherichia phage vB_EcoM_VR7]ADR32510.1 hypothetical protein VR7_gp135 [Escherichia phage vB_EcoM_VR7]
MMGRPLEDLTGKIINGIKFVSVAYKTAGVSTKWNCICHCGKEFVTAAARIKSGKTKSCGCQKYHYSFISDKPTYSSYAAMIERCTNPNHHRWKQYGGAGVQICDRWLPKGKTGYLNFVEDMGIRPAGTSINRINSCKLYSKETCEWASSSIQSFDQDTRKDSPGPITGVKFRKDRGKWISYITVNHKEIQLYYGDSRDEAMERRRAAELKYYNRQK